MNVMHHECYAPAPGIINCFKTTYTSFPAIAHPYDLWVTVSRIYLLSLEYIQLLYEVELTKLTPMLFNTHMEVMAEIWRKDNAA